MLFPCRGECTETLRNRIRELETECKKLTIDIKLKEDQIRELEMKVQVMPEHQGLGAASQGELSASQTSDRAIPTFGSAAPRVPPARPAPGWAGCGQEEGPEAQSTPFHCLNGDYFPPNPVVCVG